MAASTAKITFAPSSDDGSATSSPYNKKSCGEVSEFDLKLERLRYILEMLKELGRLSSALDERMITYLIEMAILETNTAINSEEFGNEISIRSKRNVSK